MPCSVGLVSCGIVVFICTRPRTGRFPFPWNNTQSVHFAASSELVVVRKDGHLVWWDLGTGRTSSRPFSQPGRLEQATFSGDDRLVASVDPETWRILLWSAETLELIREFAGHGVKGSRLAFSSDRKTLATAGDDRMVKLWDVETGEELLTLEKYGGVVGDPCFSRDGKTRLTRGGFWGRMPELLLWRTAPDVPDAAAQVQAQSVSSSH